MKGQSLLDLFYVKHRAAGIGGSREQRSENKNYENASACKRDASELEAWGTGRRREANFFGRASGTHRAVLMLKKKAIMSLSNTINKNFYFTYSLRLR